MALDPAWAQRRYEHALTGRKVIGRRNPDGSADLSGLNLPLDRVAAAAGRIDALAKAAKHAGDPRRIDHLRADLFLGMTDGTFAGLDDQTILEHLRTARDSEDGPDDGSGDEDGDDGSGDDEDGDEGEGGDEGDGPDDDGPDDGGVEEGGVEEGGRTADEDPAGQRGPAGVGMELRVRLSTLLGRDEYPGELAGWGPVHAELARDLATTLGGGQWHFAITDEHGHLRHCGITRARPTGSPTRSARSRQIVELQVPATTLHELADDPDTLGGWAPVLTDLLRQHTSAQQTPADDPTRRTPGAALRRQVQIRDRYCLMIGCRAPARGTDTDHTLDHARGGPTLEPNLGNTCRHDHRVKHDGGWRLDQPEPGLFRWTSRLGHSYPLRPPPIIEPLPDPLPPHGPAPPMPAPSEDDRWHESGIWDNAPPQAATKPAPRPPPEPDSQDDPPPF
ncbi:MAG: HNH endonuclease signature motif containing protein [Pseudonocardiaceae bacterium]